MKRVAALLFVCVIASPLTARASGNVALGILDGRVSLIANNATLAEILTAWSSIGHTRIVNLDRLSTMRISMELLDVSEEEALDILLRSAVGYVAVPRASFDAYLSRFDRIAIMTVKGAPVAPESRAMAPSPQRNRWVPQPAEAEENADDDSFVNPHLDPETIEERPLHPNGAPTFSAYPIRPAPKPAPADGPENSQVDSTAVPRPSAPQSSPSVPDGSTAARPGVIVQPPTAPPRRPGH